jgi:hypothetical protein
MKTFQIVCFIFIGIAFILNLVWFIQRKIKINRGIYLTIELKKFALGNIFYLVISLFFFILGFLSYNHFNQEEIYNSIFLYLLGILGITRVLVDFCEIIIVNKEGIKESGLIRWMQIKRVYKNEYKKTEIIIETIKSSY